MTEDKKDIYCKEMSNLARKQNCFDDMFVYRYTESLEVDIYDYNSYFKMYNLLPAISHSSWYLSYSYDRRENFWRINASWEDEGAILQLVETVETIVTTCMRAQSEFETCFQEVNNIIGV